MRGGLTFIKWDYFWDYCLDCIFIICARDHSFVFVLARLGDNRARKGEMWC